MILHEYETVLKQLDLWAKEARAVAKTKLSLSDKIELIRFQDKLGEVRRELRLHIFVAENISKYCFSTEQEDVLVAKQKGN